MSALLKKRIFLRIFGDKSWGGETEKSCDASLLAVSPLGDEPEAAAKLILKPYQRKVTVERLKAYRLPTYNPHQGFIT